MVTVAVVHEQMHQRAKQQRQKDECAKQVSSMLHPEVHPADRQESDHDQSGRG
jgi:hypothetical protein